MSTSFFLLNTSFLYLGGTTPGAFVRIGSKLVRKSRLFGCIPSRFYINRFMFKVMLCVTVSRYWQKFMNESLIFFMCVGVA